MIGGVVLIGRSPTLANCGPNDAESLAPAIRDPAQADQSTTPRVA
jgi:hypothetical protein